MNPTNMLELQKFVLERVYENRFLFAKELKKSFQWLDDQDLVKLYSWSIGKFSERYKSIIDCVYSDFEFQNFQVALVAM